MDWGATMAYIYNQLRQFKRCRTGTGRQRCNRDGIPSAPDSERAGRRRRLSLTFQQFLLVAALLLSASGCSRPSPEPYIALLKSVQSVQREKAAGKLLKYGDEVVPRLIQEADSEYTRVRFEVIRLLGRIRDPRAVPTLIKALDDKSSKVAALAAWGLGELKASAAVPHLLRYQNEISTDLRAEVIRGLGLCFAGPDTVTSADGDSSQAAIKRAFEDGEPKVRIAAIQASRQFGYGDLTLDLIRCSRDESDKVRYVAVQALGQAAIGRTPRSRGLVGEQMRLNIVQALTLSLSEPAQSIRKKAIRALEMIGAPEAIPQLQRLRESGTVEDRREAGRVLDGLSDKAASAAG